MTHIFSKILDTAINEIAKLPGIGKRTALRLALHINRLPSEEVEQLLSAIKNLKTELHSCEICHNLSDNRICTICNNNKRNPQLICVVQDIRDVIAIEATHQFSGVYHVLGGVISPMDGIGPGQLTLQNLFDRIAATPPEEVILALPATIEGDTTNFYIYKNIRDNVKRITTIARGIGIGEELEFTDEVTLGRSFIARTDFETAYSKNS